MSARNVIICHPGLTQDPDLGSPVVRWGRQVQDDGEGLGMVGDYGRIREDTRERKR